MRAEIQLRKIFYGIYVLVSPIANSTLATIKCGNKFTFKSLPNIVSDKSNFNY